MVRVGAERPGPGDPGPRRGLSREPVRGSDGRELPPVDTVRVAIPTGRVTVHGSVPPDDATVAETVEDTGHDCLGRARGRT